MSIPLHDYIYFRKLLLSNQQNVNINHLSTLKLMFKNDINSNRLFDFINTLEELIEVLEKRDYVSQNDITIFKQIAEETDNVKYLSEINRPNNSNKFKNSVLQCKPINDENDVKQRIYNIISQKIGHKWKEFARALNVIESKIDDLKVTYSNKSEYCALEVLNFHEYNVHPRDWKTLLLNALEKVRRNDLKKEINYIFDNFP